MGTSIIDGTVEEATLKRARSGVAVFSNLRFQSTDGASRTIKNAVTTQAVADELKPGIRGRFYLFTSFDIKGVHGVRRADGRAIYGFPGNNRKIFLILGLINLAWVAFRLFVIQDGVPLLGVALLILAIVGYVLMGKGAREAQAQFDADASAAVAADRPASIIT